jgi:RNA polymerase sigma factor (sigma-70 family)
MSDYRIKITIRNDRLLRAIEEAGYKNVQQFALDNFFHYEKVNRLIRGVFKPITEEGSLKPFCSEVLRVLGKKIEDCFTPKQLQGFKKSTFVTSVDEKTLMQLSQNNSTVELKLVENDVKKIIDKIFLENLRPKEERILRMRYGIGLDTSHTLEQIGLEFSVTRERIRDLETKAIEKLKKPHVAKQLINTGFYELFTKVDVSKKQLNYGEKNDLS